MRRRPQVVFLYSAYNAIWELKMGDTYIIYIFLLLLFYLFIFLLYHIVLVLPYINMHPPRVYTSYQAYGSYLISIWKGQIKDDSFFSIIS